MKSLKRIVTLFIVSVAIVAFWVAPGINKAEGRLYTRVYEDTDQTSFVRTSSVMAGDTTKSTDQKSKSRRKKKYRKESIESGSKISKIRPPMFSRAVHFTEEMPLTDSTEAVTASKVKYDNTETDKKIVKE